MKNIFLLLFVCFFSLESFSQDKIKAFSINDFGAEFQIYPTGLIPSLRAETNLSNKDALNFRIGMNLFDHKDFPKKAGINNHISEKGYGYGFSFGYRHYFWNNVKNLFVGVRSDLWFNKVDWKENEMKVPPTPIKGTSNIIVLQPTIETGWLFELGKNKNIFLSPEIAFGYEYNAVVKGAQTGYGFIFLGGISAGYRFNNN